MRARILGCGSSGGVPRLGTGWGACDPKEPRNRRSRCSLLVGDGTVTILIDTSPDLREQLLAAETHRLEAVFFTHTHADQAHGIDDLRGFVVATRRRIPIYAEPNILAELTGRFAYCFRQVHDYPPILDAHALEGPLKIGALRVTPFQVRHGTIDATGYRINDLGYIPDVSDFTEEAVEALTGVSTLIIDALHHRPHPSHLSVAQALDWIERIAPKRAILTNMHVDLDYRTLLQTLPAGIEPAYDGLEVPLAASA